MENPKEESRSLIRNLTQIDERTLAAQTQLSLGSWSQDYLHGPDVIEAACELIEQLLEPGEDITTIQTLRFQKLMTRDLTIFVSSNSLSPSYNSQNSSTIGSFLTTNSRLINIACFQTGEVVTTTDGTDTSLNDLRTAVKTLYRAPYVPYDTFRPRTNTYKFKLPSNFPNNLKQRLKLILELGMLVATDLTGTGFSGGAQNLLLPSNKDLEEGCIIRITIFPLRNRTTRSGFIINPLTLKFEKDNDSQEKIGSGEVTTITGSEKAFKKAFRDAGIQLKPAPLYF